MNLPSHRTKTHTDWLSEIQGQENTDHNKRSRRCLRWMVSSQENKPHQVKTKRVEMLFQTSMYFSKRTTRRRLLSAAVDQKGNARRGIKKKKRDYRRSITSFVESCSGKNQNKVLQQGRTKKSAHLVATPPNNTPIRHSKASCVAGRGSWQRVGVSLSLAGKQL